MKFSELMDWRGELPPMANTSAASSPAAPLTVQSILDTIDALKKAVIPVSIWCVDTPNWLSTMKKISHLSVSESKTIPTWDGIPVYEFYMHLFNRDDQSIIAHPSENLMRLQATEKRVVYPFFCRIPGVYILMSDGSVQVIVGSQPAHLSEETAGAKAVAEVDTYSQFTEVNDEK